MAEERKLVTILFADVTGSTSLGEALDPEDVRVLMGRYYEHAREVMGSYGGTLEKFIGDAVMAVFGLPVAHGDDAERALAAAQALQEAIRQDPYLGASFQLRMGVNTGEVMATTDATRSDFLVTGDTVNVAARLQQHANPDEIVAGERTAQAARQAFVFGEGREVQVKGKQLPLRVYPLLARRASREVERPPLVGRKQDLLQLELLRERALEEERPQLVTLLAPAGTGKTRLLEEFLQRLDEEQSFQVATARCVPYGQTLTYWPLQGLLRELLGVEVSREQVLLLWQRGGYSVSDASRLSEVILSTLGLEGESTGSVERELVFNAWRLLIEQCASQAPRIIIFEDLHWASESLLDLVEHITHIRTHAALLLIALSRPELLDRRPQWGGGRQNFTTLALQPLSEKQTGELLRKLAVQVPEQVRQQISERSGGNPFFALELLRGLSERGLAGSQATAEALPDTVHAAVLARLDLLSKTERGVLQVASVASRVFSAWLLRGVLQEFTEEEIDAALRGLQARDMIVEAPGNSYTFRHMLILDITYGTLARAERIRLHKAIAAYLYAEAGEEHVDEQVELLAYHYHKAVQLARMSAVPQQMEVETERAIRFLRRAGELASRAGAFQEAWQYFQNAIALAGESEQLALYEILGDNLALGLGWADQARDAYKQALSLWRTQESRQALLGARLIRKFLIRDLRLSHQRTTTMEDALALWREGVLLAEQAEDADEVWRERVIPLFLLMRGDISDAQKASLGQGEDALDIQQMIAEASSYFTGREDWDFLSELLDAYTLLQLRAGENREALETIKQRLQFPHVSLRERSDAIGMFIVVSMVRGEYAAGVDMMYKALDELRPGEPIEYFGNMLGITLWLLYLTGRWSEVPRFKQALNDAWKRVQDVQSAWNMLTGGYLALLCLALAREDRADIDAYEAMLHRLIPTFLKERPTPLTQAYRDENFSQVIADLLEQSSRTEDTNSVDIDGMLIMPFSEYGLPLPEVFRRRKSVLQDELTLLATKIAQAVTDDDNEALSAAIEEAEAHHLIVHAARMRIVLARRTGDVSQLERARPVLEGLEDRLFLRKLREVEAALQEPA